MRKTSGPSWRILKFQSAPAIAGGRCRSTGGAAVPALDVSIRARHCWRAMHQACAAGGARHAVSIRARHCWRAMPGYSLQDVTATIEFQSAPAIAGGRCAGRALQGDAQTCFNPRPPLLAGDAAAVSVASSTKSPFQSAPAIAGGRCRGAGGLELAYAGFNPRPPLLAGDAPLHRPAHARVQVSIRARHCWRAMHVGAHHFAAILGVSIRARHCWRAMRVAAGDHDRLRLVSIRARHCWRAMHEVRRTKGLPPVVSIRARHCWRAMHGCDGVHSVPQKVSIRARHCWRAMPGILDLLRAGFMVSIRARHCWRAMQAAAIAKPAPAKFQSAPAIAGGRCHARPAGQQCHDGFNPRPPLLAGDALHYQRLASPVLFPVLARTSVRPFDWSNRLMRARRKSIERQRLMKRANLFDATPSLQVRDAHDSTAPCPTAPTAHQNPPP